MKAKQGVVIRTDPRRRSVTGDGVIEHAAYRRPVDAFAADAEADDTAGKHVHDHKDPMAAKQNRFATKQVHAPEAVLGLRDEGEPGGTRGARMILVAVLRKDPTHDVLINLHGEYMRDLLSNALIGLPPIFRTSTKAVIGPPAALTQIDLEPDIQYSSVTGLDCKRFRHIERQRLVPHHA